MITLDENKKYFILIDGQGLTFGGGAIYESIEEVINCFREWADNDDINIVGWQVADLIPTWEIDIKQYNGKDFVELDEETLKTIIEAKQ